MLTKQGPILYLTEEQIAILRKISEGDLRQLDDDDDLIRDTIHDAIVAHEVLAGLPLTATIRGSSSIEAERGYYRNIRIEGSVSIISGDPPATEEELQTVVKQAVEIYQTKLQEEVDVLKAEVRARLAINN